MPAARRCDSLKQESLFRDNLLENAVANTFQRAREASTSHSFHARGAHASSLDQLPIPHWGCHGAACFSRFFLLSMLNSPLAYSKPSILMLAGTADIAVDISTDPGNPSTYQQQTILLLWSGAPSCVTQARMPMTNEVKAALHLPHIIVDRLVTRETCCLASLHLRFPQCLLSHQELRKAEFHHLPETMHLVDSMQIDKAANQGRTKLIVMTSAESIRHQPLRDGRHQYLVYRVKKPTPYPARRTSHRSEVERRKENARLLSKLSNSSFSERRQTSENSSDDCSDQRRIRGMKREIETRVAHPTNLERARWLLVNFVTATKPRRLYNRCYIIETRAPKRARIRRFKSGTLAGGIRAYGEGSRPFGHPLNRSCFALDLVHTNTVYRTFCAPCVSMRLATTGNVSWYDREPFKLFSAATKTDRRPQTQNKMRRLGGGSASRTVLKDGVFQGGIPLNNDHEWVGIGSRMQTRPTRETIVKRHGGLGIAAAIFAASYRRWQVITGWAADFFQLQQVIGNGFVISNLTDDLTATMRLTNPSREPWRGQEYLGNAVSSVLREGRCLKNGGRRLDRVEVHYPGGWNRDPRPLMQIGGFFTDEARAGRWERNRIGRASSKCLKKVEVNLKINKPHPGWKLRYSVGREPSIALKHPQPIPLEGFVSDHDFLHKAIRRTYLRYLKVSSHHSAPTAQGEEGRVMASTLNPSMGNPGPLPVQHHLQNPPQSLMALHLGFHHVCLRFLCHSFTYSPPSTPVFAALTQANLAFAGGHSSTPFTDTWQNCQPAIISGSGPAQRESYAYISQCLPVLSSTVFFILSFLTIQGDARTRKRLPLDRTKWTVTFRRADAEASHSTRAIGPLEDPTPPDAPCCGGRLPSHLEVAPFPGQLRYTAPQAEVKTTLPCRLQELSVKQTAFAFDTPPDDLSRSVSFASIHPIPPPVHHQQANLPCFALIVRPIKDHPLDLPVPVYRRITQCVASLMKLPNTIISILDSATYREVLENERQYRPQARMSATNSTALPPQSWPPSDLKPTTLLRRKSVDCLPINAPKNFDAASTVFILLSPIRLISILLKFIAKDLSHGFLIQTTLP
ncbi:hypothetical protein CCUS01_15878 [Colletotrichum cuscutae]|uniref:Uncharacterized protein n=1 Tax=Colletotrichum cuscutae TaxID=1209917 RepID=A0AAI9VC65_9PEZI|nr:hypothetical protein CCUS01_15878 [Colletotrichum cuscutae]